MARRQAIKGIVEDLVRRVQYEVRRLEQFHISLDQGKCPRADVLFNRARRVWPDVERTVDHRPWKGWACGVDRLDAKQRGDDGGRSMTLDRQGDRLSHIVRPHGHPALKEWTGLCQIAARRLHRILDDTGHAGTEVDVR